jgi:hypothetical protein
MKKSKSKTFFLQKFTFYFYHILRVQLFRILMILRGRLFILIKLVASLFCLLLCVFRHKSSKTSFRLFPLFLSAIQAISCFWFSIVPIVLHYLSIFLIYSFYCSVLTALLFLLQPRTDLITASSNFHVVANSLLHTGQIN